MNKKILFAALLFAALSVGFTACENLKEDLKDPASEQTDSDKNKDANTDETDGKDDNTDGDVTPPRPEVFALVATGGATDVAYRSVTLWGRINTDTLWAFPNIKWGIECSTSKETIRSHSGNKTLCTTDLVGENSDEYTVAFTGLEGGKMLYYNAYLLINDMKYIYGEVDSVHLDVRLTVNSSNSSFGTVTGSGTYDHLAEVTLTATAERGFMFIEWNDGNMGNPRIVIANEDVTYTAFFAGAKGTENGHEWVDLGLPSGTKWAACNVGAATPEGYGNYYAWGETETKSTYGWNTYKWATATYDAGYDEWDLETLTKYNTKSSYGTVDNKTVLDPEDDAARANWGGAWRMPTDAEWTELRTNCTWTWTDDYNGTGVAGRIVTSNTNGNAIFLPAAGYRDDGDLLNAGNYGDYWSSSLNADYPYYAWLVYFCSDVVGGSYSGRYFGLSVRPVLFGE